MTDKQPDQGENAAPPFVDILQEMNQEGKFEACLLTTRDGFPVAAVPNSQRQQLASAMAAVLHQVSAETREQLGMAVLDEVTLRTGDQSRLVCRPIGAAARMVILSVLVPPGRPYRRITNRAIRRIEGAMEL